MPSNIRACPLLTQAKVDQSLLATPDQPGGDSKTNIDLVPCIGAHCQWWIYDASTGPESGNCCLPALAIMTVQMLQSQQAAAADIARATAATTGSKPPPETPPSA